ncbi:MAG: hypothetical protein P9L88_05005 [Candidatus Tantalella remota]|nr:hypothetical protein [Candidatus Tantalella remota]
MFKIKKGILICSMVLVVLFAVCGSSFGEGEAKGVLVVVDADPVFAESIKGKIENGLVDAGAEVDMNSPDLVVSIVTAQVEWDNGELSNIMPMSCVVKTPAGKVWHWLIIANADNTDEGCQSLIDMIDTQVLQKT